MRKYHVCHNVEILYNYILEENVEKFKDEFIENEDEGLADREFSRVSKHSH
jgi:hypothetical protein